MLINNYLSFQSPHRSLKGFVNLVYFKNVKFRALQSALDKNTYLVEKMSAPDLWLKWKEVKCFLLSTFLLIYCSIFMKVSYSWCFWLFLQLGVKKFLTIWLGDLHSKCISYLIVIELGVTPSDYNCSDYLLHSWLIVQYCINI